MIDTKKDKYGYESLYRRYMNSYLRCQTEYLLYPSLCILNNFLWKFWLERDINFPFFQYTFVQIEVIKIFYGGFKIESIFRIGR